MGAPRQLEPRQGEFGLFGWDKVPPMADELVVAATELDAMAIWQATGRSVVAPPMGMSALPVRPLSCRVHDRVPACPVRSRARPPLLFR